MAKASVEFSEGLKSESLADQVVSLYQQWQTGRQVWLDRVREVVQYVYATSTRETSNVKNPWSHSTVIPKLTQIHDNLGANYASSLFTNPEFFTFQAATEEDSDEAKAQAVVAYLTTKHDYNGFRQTMKKLLDDWVQTGNCFCRVEYVREMGKDKDGSAFVIYEGPKVFRISPYDIVFDPTIAEFKDSPKVIRRMVTRGELMRMAKSPEGEDWDQSVVAKLKEFYNVIGTWKEADINKNIQFQMDGFSSPFQYFQSGKVELLDFIGDIYDASTGTLHESCLITIVDRRFVLRNKPLADYQGFGRIFHSGWRRRPDNLWAQGPLDNLVGLQYLINHLENARADGFDQMLSPDRVHVGQVEVEQDGPVKNYYIDEVGGSVQNLAPDGTVLSADNQIKYKEAQMEAYAGAPQEAMGIRSPGEKTAFEYSALQNAASRLFQSKLDSFEDDMVDFVLNCELEVAVRNLNSVDVAKVIDKDYGVEAFMAITVDDLSVKGKLKARGASHFSKRQQLVAELQQFEGVLKQSPEMAIHFPAKARADAWNDALNFDRFKLYLPFGQIAENMKAQQMQMSATQKNTEFQSAQVTDATNKAAPITG